MSIPALGMPLTNGSMAGPPNKRLAPQGSHPAESPAKKKQSKWSGEEDAAIIELRGNGMKWEDISKQLPGRSAISCRLRFQNYLERRSEWDDEKKNKLARLYERCVRNNDRSYAQPVLTSSGRFKKDMWEKIAKEMQLPWRAAEAMHWQIGEVEMASRANVPVFHLANPSSQASSQQQQQTTPYVQTYPTPASIGNTTESGSSSTSPSVAGAAYQAQVNYPSTHNHTLPQMSQPVSPGSNQTRRNSVSSAAETRNRSDSARDSNGTTNSQKLEPGRSQITKRYLSPFPGKVEEVEG